MKNVIVVGVPSPDREAVAQLREFGTATVHEALGRQGSLGPDIRPIQQGLALAGRAVTALCWSGDNLMIHAAIEQCGPGDILVVALTTPSVHGMFGDLFAESLAHRGAIGVVIDSGVRDTAHLRGMGFGAWSRHVATQGTVKATPGAVNVPVVIGGQVVSPGDVIVADDDGVVVVPRLSIDDTIAAAKAREAKEAATRAAFQTGQLGIDRYGLREKLVDLGVTWEQWAEAQ